jgi:fermentation-respiration switch protein FrsA (DUF1100 family)
MKKLFSVFIVLLFVTISLGLHGNGATFATSWDKTFPKSDRVDHQKVSYHNRFGITIAADMYLPKNIDKSKKYAAILVGTPYGGVKEQGAGIYAQTMAADPKELYIVPGARHIDLYDRTDMIPFDKITSFFTKYLK